MFLKTGLLDKNLPKLGSGYLNLPIICGYSLLTGLTVVYCVLLWYGSGIWWSFYSPSDSYHLPLISLLFIAPLPLPIWWQMIHWQIPAVISLFICIRWGVRSAHRQNNDSTHVLPIAMHTLWILFAICCHLLGALIPMLMIGHVIL
ncbi:MAG: hypothetical protein L3J69_07215 [Desulfobacula sp.]|nr:hypothetical protein [Desulfobacula sp.]